MYPTSRLARLALLPLVLAATSACMWGPQDGDTVQSRSSNVRFWGFFLLPNSKVDLEGRLSSGAFKGFDSTTSSPYANEAVGGTDVFYWSKTRTIPQSFWQAGILGHKAEVRATSGGTPFVSTDEHSALCYQQSRDLVDFADRCRAEKSPVARVYTEDYVGVDTGCTDDALKLIHELNVYRGKHNLGAIPASPSLCAVGQAHTVDLTKNSPNVGSCNLHSWSNAGKWSACCYTPDHAQKVCMWKKPGELTSYPGYAYENANAGGGSAAQVIQKFATSSKGHREVMLNQGDWAKHTWRAVGAGRFGAYSVLWFGEDVDPAS